MTFRDFDTDWAWSETFLVSPLVISLYERKLGSKIIRIPVNRRESQVKGYDAILHMEDGRILTVEEKVRSRFYSDLLVETMNVFEDGRIEKGWLFKTQAEVLSYFQKKTCEDDWNLTLWNPKQLAIWVNGQEFLSMVNNNVVKKIKSNSHRGNTRWHTVNYAIPFHITKTKKEIHYHQNRPKEMPLEFYDEE